MVLCMGEKSQVQALDRTQPSLPRKKGRASHDYKCNRTTTLFAALDVLTGTVIGQCLPRHRHKEFLKFLDRPRIDGDAVIAAGQGSPGRDHLRDGEPVRVLLAGVDEYLRLRDAGGARGVRVVTLGRACLRMRGDCRITALRPRAVVKPTESGSRL